MKRGIADLSSEGYVDAFLHSMARADFRKVEHNGISVNICLPDRIFEEGSATGRRLAQFSYIERLNLISMARSFVQLTAGALTAVLNILVEINDPVFRFSAKAAKG
jgi:hypothetical protein